MIRLSPSSGLLLALAIAAVDTRIASAQQQPMVREAPVIRSDETRSRDAVPGKTATVVFSIVSTVDRPAVYRAAVVLPAGWRLLSGSGLLTLGARARETVLVLVGIPALATAGHQRVELRLTDERDGSRIISRGVANITIASNPRLELVALEAPEFVAAGSPYLATFLLRNTGNAGVAVRLRVRGYPDFPMKLDSVSYLPAGKEQIVRAIVSTRLTDKSSLTHRVEISVALASADTAVVAKAQSGVLVVARAADDRAGAYSIPAQLRIIGGGRSNSRESGALAFELSGKGALSDGGTTRIDFLARRSRSTRLPFALRDEYRFELAGTSYDVRIGQQLFALTPLVREGRSGSGASGWMRMGPLTVGGFRSDERWDPVTNRGSGILRRPENAAFAELRPAQAIGLGLSYLSSSDFPAGELWTARLRFDPYPLVRVSVESGTGLGAAAGQRGSMITASGDSRHLSYYMRHERADTGFAGTRPGTSGSYGTVAVRPTQRLQLFAAARDLSTSFAALRGGARIAGWSRERDAGVSIPGMIAVTYRMAERDFGGLSVPGSLRTTEVRLTPRLPLVAIDAEFERGSLNGTDGVVRPVESIYLRSSIGRTFGRSISAFVRREKGPWRFAAYDGTRWTEGVNAVLRTRRGLLLELFATRVEDSTAGVVATSSMVDGVVGFTTHRGYGAELRWRAVASGAARTNPEMQLTLTIPLGIPARRAGNVGSVTGRVYDIETGRGVPNALVKLGDQAVLTDRSGRLIFGAVRPDTYNVQLDPGSVGGGRVPLTGAAAPVTARAGKTTRIELGVGRSSRVAVRVRLYAPADPLQWNGAIDQTTDNGGIAGLIVTLSNGEQTLRRVTDSEGSFEITDLRPGRWTASVAGNDLPPLHYVASDLTPSTVTAGETATIEIRVVPRKRTLRIVSGGEVTVTTEAAGESRLPPSNPVQPQAVGQKRALPEAALAKPVPAGSARKAATPAVSRARRRPMPPAVYSIQVGRYKDRSGAEYLSASLRRHRVPAGVMGKSAPFHVVVGRYLSLREADKALLDMRKEGRMDGVVVRMPER